MPATGRQPSSTIRPAAPNATAVEMSASRTIANSRSATNARSPERSTHGSVTSLPRRPAIALATRNHFATIDTSPTATGPASSRGNSAGSIAGPAAPGTRTRAIVCWSITVLPNSQPTRPLTTATATTASTQRSMDARQ